MLHDCVIIRAACEGTFLARCSICRTVSRTVFACQTPYAVRLLYTHIISIYYYMYINRRDNNT